MAYSGHPRDAAVNRADTNDIIRQDSAAMETGIERLFDLAMAVSTLATRAEIFRHVEFPVDLDRALTDLSELLTELEPGIKDYSELA